MPGFVAEHCLKWRHADGGVRRGVVPKLRQWNPVAPTPRAGVCEIAEVRLEALVHMLRLPIGLRMVGYAEAKLRSRVLEELAPEVAGEDYGLCPR